MKKYFCIIVTIFLFFATSSLAFAKEGTLGDLLDLNYGVETFKLESFGEVGNYHFSNHQKKVQFSTFKQVNEILKNEFIRMYKDGELDYYAMNGVVKNYNLFLYHTDKRFLYDRLKELGTASRELDDGLLRNITLSRNYYMKVRYIIKRNRIK